jgi:Undecaprenyl-phosphate galactose phosphotransferase WbaP
MYAGFQTKVQDEVEFDLDDLQSLFTNRNIDQPSKGAVTTVAARRMLVPLTPSPVVALPLEPNVPMDLGSLGAIPKWNIFLRSFRTVGPLLAGDLLALTCTGFFAQWVVGLVQGLGIHPLAWALSATLFPLVIAYWVSGLYSEIWLHPVIELRQLTHLTSIVLLAAAAAGGIVKPALSVWYVAAWPAALFFVPLFRAIVRQMFAGLEWWRYPTLVIDSGGGAGALTRSLLGSPKSGLRPVLMTDPNSRCCASLIPVVNDPDALRSLLRTQGIRHGVASLPEFPVANVARTLDRFSSLVPHLLVLSDASTLPALWSASHSFGRLSGIEIRNGLLLATLQRLKRLVDVTICLTVLILSFPLLCVIVATIKLTDPGPVFFGHTRIGRHGRRFKTWKFRTMRVNADALLEEYLANDPAARKEWDQSHKLRRDPRVTRMGQFLRNTSLDELPQIWNVLKGEMSLVGPRPIVDEEIWRYGDAIRLYITVKPGITGLWQASGRAELSYDDRVLLDQFYVRHWSPWLDAFVLAKTVIALVRRDGAY